MTFGSLRRTAVLVATLIGATPAFAEQRSCAEVASLPSTDRNETEGMLSLSRIPPGQDDLAQPAVVAIETSASRSARARRLKRCASARPPIPRTGRRWR